MRRFSYRRLKRAVRFFIQRRRRGWDDSQTWSLDSTIAKFVLPRLKRFKELNNGHPWDMTEEEWNGILDKIIFAMEAKASEDEFWSENMDERKAHWAKVEEGLELFGKHFHSLWW